MSQDESQDEAQDFLNNLPELKKGEKYAFLCEPGVECFNACCGDLDLMLTPYDVFRLRKELGKASRDFIQGYCEVAAAGSAGFPMAKLRMQDDAKRSCPFVRTEGCSVYGNRPGACRTYPLGRAARMTNDGDIVEQYFVVQEDHCKGFGAESKWSSQEWLADQGLEEYNEFNDRYMLLINRYAGLGLSLDAKKLNICFLALYQLDDFQKFILQMRLFERVNVSDERKKRILEDELEALSFGLDWMELMLFGESENLENA